MQKSLARSLLLRGNIVHLDGEARDRYVLVRDGRIVSVGRRRPPLSSDVPYVETERNDWIFPGLINLHSHTDYNLLPLWRTAMAPFNNRFEWRNDFGYSRDVKELHKSILGKENEKGVAVFAELQAVAGGTSILQENCPLDREVDGHGELLLCRDTSVPEDLGLDANQSTLSVVDWFRPDQATGLPKPVDKAIASYVDLRQKGTLAATIVHLAEGRSGFGANLGFDPYSRREFEAFMAHPAFQDAGAVRSSPLTLVHCTGIDVSNREHVAFLRDRNISIVWSPVSNLLLYGDTLDVETLLNEGINVGLGSDWAPSGSKHVWEEAKFARFYFDALDSMVSDEQIFQMVTTAPARCLGVPHLGRIEPGGLGDFFILRSPLESDNALEIFLSTSDRHVRATIIGGAPIYGERSLLSQFGVTLQDMPHVEGSAVANKAVHLPEEFGIDVERDIGKIEAALKALPTPVKRSNLLVASDKPYRRRIQTLRADAERFGWSTQVWRHDGPLKHAGVAPVPPDSVRVCVGFRADGAASDAFRNTVSRVLIPATVQTQAPLGMTAYLPAVLPDAKPASVPDHVALMFYESQAVAGGTANTTFGRVHEALQGALFSRASRSAFPKLLADELAADQPYFLFTDAVDWYGGRCRVMVAMPKPGTDPQAFRISTRQALGALQQARPDGLDGALVVATDGCVLCWEHWSADIGKGAVEALAGLTDPVLITEARPEKVASGGFELYPGLDIDPQGAALNLKFVRRTLRPG